MKNTFIGEKFSSYKKFYTSSSLLGSACSSWPFPKRKFSSPVLETDILAVIQKEIAQKRETIHFAQVGNRTELLEKEQLELDVMQEYLPQQLTREEIRAAVDEIITEVGPQFRAVMPVASQRLKGKADGRMVNEVVKEATS